MKGPAVVNPLTASYLPQRNGKRFAGGILDSQGQTIRCKAQARSEGGLSLEKPAGVDAAASIVAS